MSGLKTLSTHTVIYLVGSLGAKLASFLLLKVFTPLIPPADYGVLELTDNSIALLLQVAGLQLDAALTRSYLHAEAGPERRRVAQTAFAAVFGLNLLAALVLAAFASPLAAHFLERPGQPRLVLLAGAILVGMVAAEVPLAVLKAEQRSIAATSWQLLRLVFELTFKAALVVGVGLGATGVLLGQAAAAILFLIGFGWWYLRRFGAGFDAATFRSLAAYSAPMVIAGLCQFALHNADRFLFRFCSDLHQLGLYGIAYKIGYAPSSIVLSAFLLIWYPFVFAQKDDAARRRAIGQAAVHVAALLVLVSLPIALFAREIVAYLTDPAFHGAWTSVPVIAFAYLFWGLFQIVQTPFYSSGRTREVPRVVLISAALNLALNALLLPRLGAMGAALATLAAMVLLVAVARRAAQRVEPVAIDWSRLLGPLAITALCAAAIYVPAQGGAASWIARGVALVVALVYFGALFLREHEKSELLALIKRRPAA